MFVRASLELLFCSCATLHSGRFHIRMAKKARLHSSGVPRYRAKAVFELQGSARASTRDSQVNPFSRSAFGPELTTKVGHWRTSFGARVLETGNDIRRGLCVVIGEFSLRVNPHYCTHCTQLVETWFLLKDLLFLDNGLRSVRLPDKRHRFCI